MKSDRLILKQGDSIELLKDLPDESIDAIISDPPYKLTSIINRFGKENSTEAQFGSDGRFKRLSKGFMGKIWDSDLPSVEILKESLRVLKSGSFALWLMTPRQDSQMEFLLRLKQAGFVIGFTPLYWTYSSGFPKAQNVSRAIDRKLGVERQVSGIDSKFGRVDSGIYNFNNPENSKKVFERKDIPVSEIAKQLNGSYSGFQPKPAVEVVIVSMKPLSEKTYVDQALKRIGQEQNALKEIKDKLETKYNMVVEWE